MTPTLYHVPKTISSPIVQTLLEIGLVGSNIQVETISFADLKNPSHLAINPMGTSPAFKDGDTILWESGAVLNYLLETYDKEAKLYAPPGSPKRAKYLQLQQYIIATVYPFIASLYIHTLKEEQDKDYVENAKAKWRELLAPTLTNWLGEGPFFLGNQMSVVDFLAAKPLNNVKSMDMLEEFPSLKALFDKIQSRPSFSEAYGMVMTPVSEQPKSRTLSLVPTDP
jgi:glutathione S-transferase